MSEEIKVLFIPGCFDDFEGTQEELDNFVTEIEELFTSGKFEEISVPIEDIEDLEHNTPRVLN